MDKFYRERIEYTLPHKLEIKYKFTDIFILSDKTLDAEKILDEIKRIYRDIENYTLKKPLFLSSLKPIHDKNPPSFLKEIFIYSQKTRLGPLAGIAGFFSKKIAEFIKRNFSPKNLIIENGGDIFIKRDKESKILIYAGDSPFSMKIGFKIEKGEYGIATSSKKVGHSLSFGNADAVTVISKNPIAADFYATMFGNMLKGERDIEKVLKNGKRKEEIKGMVIIFNDKIGVFGVEIFKNSEKI